MTILLQELPVYQQARIAPDEQVLWCGKGRPVAWFPGAVGQCIMGFLLLMVLSFFGSVFVPTTFRESTTLAGKVVVVAFHVLFGTICASLLFAPFWHWLATRRAVWVITDRRVLCLRGRRCDVWRDDRLLEEPEWEVVCDDGGRDFVFGQHFVSSRHGSRWERDRIESVPPEDVARVEAALLRLTECRMAEEAAALPGQIADVSARFSVLHEPGNCVRIVYRKNRSALGSFLLATVIGFLALMVILLVRAGDTPVPVYFLFLPILVFGVSPFVYLAFGRREIVLEGGSGRYFNGVGRIGFSRTFTYDRHSLVQEGRTDYQVNGRYHYSVMLRERGKETSRQILAHGEQAVIKEFVRHLRLALRQS
ncbi:MAG: hypothetical protein ACI4R9_05090 [Kiritimatiellia bacterium]